MKAKLIIMPAGLYTRRVISPQKPWRSLVILKSFGQFWGSSSKNLFPWFRIFFVSSQEMYKKTCKNKVQL